MPYKSPHVKVAILTDQNRTVQQCPVFRYVHNQDVIRDCGRCKHFKDIIPTVPYRTIECWDLLLTHS